MSLHCDIGRLWSSDKTVHLLIAPLPINFSAKCASSLKLAQPLGNRRGLHFCNLPLLYHLHYINSYSLTSASPGGSACLQYGGQCNHMLLFHLYASEQTHTHINCLTTKAFGNGAVGQLSSNGSLAKTPKRLCALNRPSNIYCIQSSLFCCNTELQQYRISIASAQLPPELPTEILLSLPKQKAQWHH